MMTNAYHSEIVQILLRCGREGLPVAEISRCIYNKHADIFNRELTFDSIHQTLRCYMWRQIHYRHSIFRKVRYGVYALKQEAALQMEFDFDNTLPEPPLELPKGVEALKSDPGKNLMDDPRQMNFFDELFS